MSDVRIRSFNAYRAKRFGYVITPSDALIMMRSFLHTHTELQFSERYNNVSFSATLAEGANGCRFKQINYSHPVYWDTVICPKTDDEEDIVYAEAERLNGQPYDGIGLASFVSRADIIKPRPGYWWCSRVVVHLIQQAYKELPLVPEETHPTWCDTICRWYFAEKRKI